MGKSSLRELNDALYEASDALYKAEIAAGVDKGMGVALLDDSVYGFIISASVLIDEATNLVQKEAYVEALEKVALQKTRSHSSTGKERHPLKVMVAGSSPSGTAKNRRK